MSVYFKGMEMPTTCGSCWFCHAISNEKWHCRLTGKSFVSYSVGWGSENNTGENGQHPYIRRDDCPLIEVPEPHGRLGDLDELYVSLEKWLIQNRHNMTEATRVWIRGVLEGIAAAPTVIPVSEEANT